MLIRERGGDRNRGLYPTVCLRVMLAYIIDRNAVCYLIK